MVIYEGVKLLFLHTARSQKAWLKNLVTVSPDHKNVPYKVKTGKKTPKYQRKASVPQRYTPMHTSAVTQRNYFCLFRYLSLTLPNY